MNFNERWSGRFCHGRLEISNRFFIIQPVARRKIQSAHPAPPVLFPRSFSCFCHYAGKGNFPAPTAADVFITKRIKLAGQRIGNKTPLSILSLSLSHARGPKIKYPNICRFNLNHARLQATSFNNETSYCTWQGRIASPPAVPPRDFSNLLPHVESCMLFLLSCYKAWFRGIFRESFAKSFGFRSSRQVDVRSLSLRRKKKKRKKRRREKTIATISTVLLKSSHFEIIITPSCLSILRIHGMRK